MHTQLLTSRISKKNERAEMNAKTYGYTLLYNMASIILTGPVVRSTQGAHNMAASAEPILML